MITQGLDDHAHARTLSRLSDHDPELPVIAPPSARPTLERASSFRRVEYIASRTRRVALPYLGLDTLPPIRLPPSRAPSEAIVRPRGGANGGGGGLRVQSTQGALVGPPWQRRENGYVFRAAEGGGCPSIYLEPHVEFDPDELAQLAPVDAVITPIQGQSLPGFELVHGASASTELVSRLRPRWVVPMDNGAVEARGLSAPFVNEVGARAEFEARLSATGSRTAELVEVRPGEPFTLTLVSGARGDAT